MRRDASCQLLRLVPLVTVDAHTGTVRWAKMVVGTEDEDRPVHKISFAFSELWADPEGAAISKDLWLDLEIHPSQLQFLARWDTSKGERLLTE